MENPWNPFRNSSIDRPIFLERSTHQSTLRCPVDIRFTIKNPECSSTANNPLVWSQLTVVSVPTVLSTPSGSIVPAKDEAMPCAVSWKTPKAQLYPFALELILLQVYIPTLKCSLAWVIKVSNTPFINRDEIFLSVELNNLSLALDLFLKWHR